MTDYEQSLIQQNRILRAGRKLSQLITREKDPLRLLKESCRLLAENRGFSSICIILTRDGQAIEPYFHAGFDGGFAPMSGMLHKGDLPSCAEAALSTGELQVIDDPASQCPLCPIASSSSGSACLSLRIEYQGHVFGWMILSCRAETAHSAEIQDLIRDMAGDIAYALRAMENNGALGGISGIGRDVTMLKKALHSSEEDAWLMADLVMKSNQPVAAGYLDGRLGRFNPAFCDLTGYTEEELQSINWSVDLTPSEWRAYEAGILDEILKTGKSVRYEKEFIMKDGSRVPVELFTHITLNAEGKPDYLYAFVSDISVRKQVEKTLRESERRLRTLMGNLPGMAYRCLNTLQWSMEFVSEGCISLTGYSSKELTTSDGVSYGDLVYTDEREKIWHSVQDAIEKKEAFVLEYRIRDKGGRERWVWEQGRAVDISRNGVAILEGFITDISGIKKAESERESLLYKMNERTKELTCLFGISESIRKRAEMAQVLQDAVELIPSGWQYPEITRGLIRMGDRVYVSQPFEENEWFLRADIISSEKRCGTVEVYYLHECPIMNEGPFLREERDLIDGIARMLGEAMELELVNKERKMLAQAIEQADEAIVITDCDAVIQYINPSFERSTGYSRDEAIGNNPNILKSFEQDEVFYRQMWEKLSGGTTWSGRFVNKRKDGALFTEEAVISPVFDKTGRTVNYVAVKRNITNELVLEDQLRQAQKMEAIGRLAGGIAHDFNNMLGVILGHTEIILEFLEPGHAIHANLLEIQKAGNRSADLTRQLLSFARKQTVSPLIIDLNKTVSSMINMLKRLIGEDIDLYWLPGEALWSVRIDPGQVDQILANLCVNARDSIADVGKITIETDNVVLDNSFSSVHSYFLPGEYVMVAVSDNGCGMESEMLDNIFEPFFTTKDLGKGTGLGLAMVYGIVKQNKGHISTYSEPGLGTIFKIYLPREVDAITSEPDAEGGKAFQRGSETILLVEDEKAILGMTKIMLEDAGYAVLSAETPGKAIDLAHSYGGRIHMLMTDVIMPEMNGRDLAAYLMRLYPNLRCLFMSGYTSNVMANHGMLEEGTLFLQKPFTKMALVEKVRFVLDRE